MAAIEIADQSNHGWGNIFVLVLVILVVGSFAKFIPAVVELDSLMLERTVYLMVLAVIVFLTGIFVTSEDL